MNVDNHIKDTVTSKMNYIANKLHERIRNVVHAEAEAKKEGDSKTKSSEPSDKVKTTNDLKEVKAMLRVISADLEYPNEQKDTYKKFLEIEQFYNERL